MVKPRAAVLLAVVACFAAPATLAAPPAPMAAVASPWKQIYEDSQTIYYVSATNSSSATTSDVESLLEYKVPQVLGGTQVWSVVSHMKLDCDAKKVVTIDNTTYSRQMGSGRAIQTLATNDTLHEPDAGSLGELIWSTACGKN
jgi:hypothetical protein